MVKSPIGIAGAGRIGQALGRLLRDRGEPVVAVAGRDGQRTAVAAAFVGDCVQPVPYAALAKLCSRVLIAVPDDAMQPVVRILADEMRGGMALHTCGARGPEALAPLEALGVSCAAMHPLQSVTTPEQGVTAIPGSSFAITGSGVAAAWALEIVALLHAEALQIASSQRALYHAAAVMASNYPVALIDAAVILMKEAGIQERQALRALAPMIRASVRNALTADPLQALTGPIERGDVRTVAAHFGAFSSTSSCVPETVTALYRAAGLHALDMVRRKNSAADREEMEALFQKAAPIK